MSEQVKCRYCGYLALRGKDTRCLVDAEDTFRGDGAIPRGLHPPGDKELAAYMRKWHYEDYPICFVRAADLRKEIGHKPGDEKRKEIVNQPRQCEEFTLWKQGFTPKEHQEMLDRKDFLDAQRKQAEDERKWRERESDRAERALKQSHNHHLVHLVVFGVLITLVNILTAIVVR